MKKETPCPHRGSESAMIVCRDCKEWTDECDSCCGASECPEGCEDGVIYEEVESA